MERNSSCRLLMTENRGVASAKRDVRAAGPVTARRDRQPDGSDPYGVRSCKSETTAYDSPACRQGEVVLGKCLLTHSIRFQVHTNSWVSRRIGMLTARVRVAMILRDVARRFSVRFFSSRSGAASLGLACESGSLSPAAPANDWACSVQSLNQCRYTAAAPASDQSSSGRRQTAEHVGI